MCTSFYINQLIYFQIRLILRTLPALPLVSTMLNSQPAEIWELALARTFSTPPPWQPLKTHFVLKLVMQEVGHVMLMFTSRELSVTSQVLCAGAEITGTTYRCVGLLSPRLIRDDLSDTIAIVAAYDSNSPSGALLIEPPQSFHCAVSNNILNSIIHCWL